MRIVTGKRTLKEESDSILASDQVCDHRELCLINATYQDFESFPKVMTVYTASLDRVPEQLGMRQWAKAVLVLAYSSTEKGG